MKEADRFKKVWSKSYGVGIIMQCLDSDSYDIVFDGYGLRKVDREDFFIKGDRIIAWRKSKREKINDKVYFYEPAIHNPEISSNYTVVLGSENSKKISYVYKVEHYKNNETTFEIIKKRRSGAF